MFEPSVQCSVSMDVLFRASQSTAATILLVAVCLAQQEPLPPSFRVQSDLVIMPFQVHRGSRSVSDLKPSHVVLLEDGVSRGFTVFEKPPEHLTLDLAVMFDVTIPKPDPRIYRIRVWDAKALLDLAAYWSETIVRRLLDVPGASIRFSVYRLDQTQLQRLCRFTSDPTVLLDALRRLAGPLPAVQGPRQSEDIPLPAGLAVRALPLPHRADRAAVHAPLVHDQRHRIGAHHVLAAPHRRGQSPGDAP